MILVLTNADTEILALRSVIEGLPEGFPPVRAANPASLDQEPDASTVVMTASGRWPASRSIAATRPSSAGRRE